MRARRQALFVIAVASCAWTASASMQAPKINLSEKALTAAAVRYVADYEKQFAFLIADEEYRQTVFDADGRRARTQLLKAELFLTYLPADDEWIAVRDVMEVDGQPVKGREDLRALLLKREHMPLVREIIHRNAKYNIGRVERNFNEPTLPLLLLSAKRIPRIKFDRLSVVKEPDATLATLAFEERQAPTLIQSREEGSVRSKGQFLLDAATGTVRHTLFQLTRPGIDVRLETSYVKDEKLKLWVPSVFTERYETGDRIGGARTTNPAARASSERVECEAKYSNYRRFEVTARIK